MKGNDMDMQNTARKGPKIALLSNVNMDFVIRMLQKHVEIYRPEGYGNELGILINPCSSYHTYEPDITFLVMDLMELLEHRLDLAEAKQQIDGWFAAMDPVLEPEKVYYISDAYLWGVELAVLSDTGRKAALEQLWQEGLEGLCYTHSNVRILPYCRLVESLGEEGAFSLKMWYMGKMLLGNEAQKRLCGLILDKVRIEKDIPKKVLALDLDNTLWGGLAGENDHTPIRLSEEQSGLAYKSLQRVLLQMKKQGVLLAIVSKNNEADAMEILKNHPHMLLRPENFAAMRINWKSKHENLVEIAGELNLNVDSFVFWDDSPAERQLVKEMLPQVTVPDFPRLPEELALVMGEIYREYFAKPVLTKEDMAKTEQYLANGKRGKLEAMAGSFEDYLKALEITAVRVNPQKHLERLTQLMNKTNQFNLTTRRYTQGQIVEMLEDTTKKVYLYQVMDRFGDNGVVVAAVVDCAKEVPVLMDLVMSCRVMGKNIEYAIVEDIEKDLRKQGYGRLKGIYIPTAKNAPVAELYQQLGYEKISQGQQGETEYELRLADAPKRMYYVKIEMDIQPEA